MVNQRYKKLKEAPQGGLANVDIYKDTHLDRKVVIKTLQDNANIDRLYDEINALLAIRSKHVVQVYDILTLQDGSLGIVEEFIDGNSLDCFTKSLSSDEYLKIIWQIASGILDIHNNGIIHRDIKPNNIKIDNENIIKRRIQVVSATPPVLDKKARCGNTLALYPPQMRELCTTRTLPRKNAITFSVV
ncbi:protein kinase domain-containing protein [Desulfovibrio cuneatus]|uniref:protein kinase domain-containing protein n=1 Tax=Desulfovibrio cuneatus TaxID=159728 RepID=UPI00068747CB|nr:protein kinase [Desulfovibrio cuneatus]